MQTRANKWKIAKISIQLHALLSMVPITSKLIAIQHPSKDNNEFNKADIRPTQFHISSFLSLFFNYFFEHLKSERCMKTPTL